MNSYRNTFEGFTQPSAESYLHLTKDETDDLSGSISGSNSNTDTYETGNLIKLAKQIDANYIEHGGNSPTSLNILKVSNGQRKNDIFAGNNEKVDQNANMRPSVFFSSHSTPLIRKSLEYRPLSNRIPGREKIDTRLNQIIENTEGESGRPRDKEGFDYYQRNDSREIANLSQMSKTELESLKNRVDALLVNKDLLVDDYKHNGIQSQSRGIGVVHKSFDEDTNIYSSSENDDDLSLTGHNTFGKNNRVVFRSSPSNGISVGSKNSGHKPLFKGIESTEYIPLDSAWEEANKSGPNLLDSALTTPPLSLELLSYRKLNSTSRYQDNLLRDENHTLKRSIPKHDNIPPPIEPASCSSNIGSTNFENGKENITFAGPYSKDCNDFARIHSKTFEKELNNENIGRVASKPSTPSHATVFPIDSQGSKNSELNTELHLLRGNIRDLNEEIRQLRLDHSEHDALRSALTHLENEKKALSLEIGSSDELITAERLNGGFKQYYNKLHLAKVDELSKVEMSNLIKNIMLSTLLTDFENLPKFVSKTSKFLKFICSFMDELHCMVYDDSQSRVKPSTYLKNNNYGVKELQTCLEGVLETLKKSKDQSIE